MASTSNGKTFSPSNPANTLSKLDAYGFERDEDFDFKTFQRFESVYYPVLMRRLQRWDHKLQQGKKKKVKSDGEVKRFCRKGVPERYRAQVWMDVCGARKKMEKNPGLYNKLKESLSETEQDRELIELINTDLERTFPDNINFKNNSDHDQKRSLYNVLLAYGRYRPEIGYCQGMNYIVALLLLVVKDEEKCFWLLATLIDDILPQYYSKSMSALRAELNVLTDLVRKKYPNVQRIMDDENIPWVLVASKWFICLFIDILPIDTVLRVWDCLFFEGSKILIRVALCIIHQRETTIQSKSGMPDIIESFKNLKEDEKSLSCHDFMQACFTDTNPLSRTEIKQLRRKHLELIEQEDAGRLAKSGAM